MAESIPFVAESEIDYGRVERLSPLIRRVTANNPGPFTYRGTGTYIIGAGSVAVIDPGPADDAHLDALAAALTGERIAHILITHTHKDHSPLAGPLQKRLGGTTYGFGAHGSGKALEGVRVEEGGDMAFRPDVEVRDGDVIQGAGYRLECVFTPGHTSNHMCFGLAEENALFTGDHVMGWSTTVIAPPDGDMAAYMASLAKLLTRDDAIYYPTHGAPIAAPHRFVRALIAHRKAREADILRRLNDAPSTIPALVAQIYAGVDKRLHPAAALSVLAHLHKLIAEGRVTADGPPTQEATYAAT
jgi:glyoxylase-like metal-dependent hydrolase (beta-lactamase superfamily II)